MAEEKKKEGPPFAKASGGERIVCHNCAKEIKPGEPKKLSEAKSASGGKEGVFVHQYEKGTGPRSEICEFC